MAMGKNGLMGSETEERGLATLEMEAGWNKYFIRSPKMGLVSGNHKLFSLRTYTSYYVLILCH